MLAGQGSNLQPPDPKSGVLPLNYRPPYRHASGRRGAAGAGPPSRLRPQTGYASWPMGSLIKKRRKRMRKKKYRKMRRRTRFQRRRGR